MADEPNVGEDLFGFAQVLVRQLLKKHRLRSSSHRVEDGTGVAPGRLASVTGSPPKGLL